MVARIPNIKIKKAYITVQIGQKYIKTQDLRSRAGELVNIEPKKINLDSEDSNAKIKIYSIK